MRIAPLSLSAALLVSVATAAGCSGSSPTAGLDTAELERSAGDSSATVETVSGPSPTSAPTTLRPSEPSSVERAAALCARTGTQVLGTVGSDDLVEASGLVASRVHPGILWSHNDGGDDPGVFAIANDGFDIGFHAVDVDGVTDLEDIAIGRDGNVDVLYLADIGDNGTDRTSVRVYRFPEPSPASVAPVTEVDVLEYVYPDRPHNAETLLVDDANQRLVIVTKEQAPDADGQPDRFGRTEASFILDGPLEGDGPIELTPVGRVGELLQRREVDLLLILDEVRGFDEERALLHLFEVGVGRFRVARPSPRHPRVS